MSSSAQYIIQHFTAATGCRKLEGAVKNIFATGKVTMAMGDHDLGSAGVSAAGAASSTVCQKGCFVMWQMVPNMWLIELVVGGHKVIAGSDGNVAWRHTPWLSAHAAKGGVRPLRRALQASFSTCYRILNLPKKKKKTYFEFCHLITLWMLCQMNLHFTYLITYSNCRQF